jgi:hypothetical protein
MRQHIVQCIDVSRVQRRTDWLCQERGVLPEDGRITEHVGAD